MKFVKTETAGDEIEREDDLRYISDYISISAGEVKALINFAEARAYEILNMDEKADDLTAHVYIKTVCFVMRKKAKETISKRVKKLEEVAREVFENGNSRE